MFVQLMINTVVAGVASPLLSDSPLHLALGATGFFLVGWLLWRWERNSYRRLSRMPAAAAPHAFPRSLNHVDRFKAAP